MKQNLLLTVTQSAAPAPKDYHRETVLTWIDILKGGLAAGAGLLVPASALPLVSTLLTKGVDVVAGLFSKTTKERWTLADIEALDAEIQALPDPAT